LVCLVVPVFSSGYVIHVATEVLIFVPLVIGQNLITGNSGQISMGHAGFYGVGAYIAAVLAVNVGIAPVWTLLLATIGGGLAGVLVGLPAIRVSGDYLFVVSMGFNLMFVDVVTNWLPVTGGSAGLPGVPALSIGPLEAGDPTTFYYVTLALCAVVVVLSLLIQSSRFGHTIEALRDDTLAVTTFGVRSGPIRVSVFGIAAAMAGLSGALLAYFSGVVSPADFGLATSILIFEMAIIGGLGTVRGAILGAAILIVLPELLRPLLNYQVGIGGAAVVLLMIVRPQGLLGRVGLTNISRR
jgi:branched-chain amino acid transport system permease protein